MDLGDEHVIATDVVVMCTEDMTGISSLLSEPFMLQAIKQCTGTSEGTGADVSG